MTIFGSLSPQLFDDRPQSTPAPGTQYAAADLSRGIVPLPIELKSVIPEWKNLAEKMKSGNMQSHEWERLNELNRMIMNAAKRSAN